MSGIVGIVNPASVPIDRRLLQQMADFMAYRGPDAQHIWTDHHVGFGHTMLRSTRESASERQPLTFDGSIWITADARVDGRRELIQKLEAKGRRSLFVATDAELILHAYHVWGEDCVQHLIGDFSFAIWDGEQERLFAARDHFGVKPFFYAHVEDCLVFGNTLSCVHLHPAVSNELNDLAIGDFLLFGYNQEVSTTSFAQIQRLPPAHYLSWSDGTLKINRYWDLPSDGEVRYRRRSDYVEHFLELFRAAVGDRLRGDRIWVWMSGGMDSTAVTAIAHERMAKQFKSFDLRACTEVYDVLLPHDERYYATLVAEALGIPIHYQVLDGYLPFERWDQPEFLRFEPSERCMVAPEIDELRDIASRDRIVLTGFGGDPGLMGEAVPDLWGHMPLPRLVADAARLFFTYHRPPPFGIRPKIRRWLSASPSRPPYPTWIKQSFAARLDLPARWEQLTSSSASVHALRPHAHAGLSGPFWPYLFDSYDPGVTFFPVEVRHPFFDTRLVNYLLAVPAIPWCMNKRLLREAMRGILPEPVRLRPKAPLAADPIQEALKRPGTSQIDNFIPARTLAAYVNPDALPNLRGEKDYLRLWVNVRVRCLNHWLQDMEAISKNIAEEEPYELAD